MTLSQDSNSNRLILEHMLWSTPLAWIFSEWPYPTYLYYFLLIENRSFWRFFKSRRESALYRVQRAVDCSSLPPHLRPMSIQCRLKSGLPSTRKHMIKINRKSVNGANHSLVKQHLHGGLHKINQSWPCLTFQGQPAGSLCDCRAFRYLLKEQHMGMKVIPCWLYKIWGK